jgi:chemotaxis protein MotD
MSGPPISAQAAAPSANLSPIGLPGGGKHADSRGGSAFAALLQEFEPKDAAALPRPGVRSGKGGSMKPAPEEDATGEETTQAQPAKAHSGLDAAAAIAAIVAAQPGVNALPQPPSGAKVLPAAATAPDAETNGLATRASARQALSAILGEQGTIDASAPDGAPIMPSDSRTSFALPTTAIVASPIGDVNVRSARTYLSVDGVGQAAKAGADASSFAAAGVAKPANVAGSPVQTTAKGANAAAATDSASAPATVAAASNSRQTGGDGPTHHDQSSGARAGGGARSGDAGGPAAGGVSPDAKALAANGVGSLTSAIVSAPIDLDQLADVIANQAQALTAQGANAAMGAVGASPVKELDVQLNPADLGSLTVKMRLSNGNLAVVIEAAKSSTARLIESERDAIVERLTSVDQPVASVVVQASDSVPTQGENSNASGSATSQQSDAQSNAANGSNGHARSSRDGEGGAQTRQNGSADDEAARRARTGDLFV